MSSAIDAILLRDLRDKNCFLSSSNVYEFGLLYLKVIQDLVHSTLKSDSRFGLLYATLKSDSLPLLSLE